MNDIQMEDLQETPTSEVIEPTQDPLKEELEKVRSTSRTEEEKAAYTLRSTAQRLTALGKDPAEILGFNKLIVSEDEDAPVTMKMLREMQAESANKSSLQLADDIQNESERELVKFHIQNTIRSTGNPSKDFELASSLVNAVKNRQVLDEIARKNQAKTYTSTGGAAPRIEPEEELSRDEQAFMRPPFNLSKEEILKARKG